MLISSAVTLGDIRCEASVGALSQWPHLLCQRLQHLLLPERESSLYKLCEDYTHFENASQRLSRGNLCIAHFPSTERYRKMVLWWGEGAMPAGIVGAGRVKNKVEVNYQFISFPTKVCTFYRIQQESSTRICLIEIGQIVLFYSRIMGNNDQ